MTEKMIIEVPASEVPAKWREGLPEDRRIKVTIELVDDDARPKLSARDMIGAAARMGLSPRQSGEIVEEVRTLRDEWSD